jgi:serine/threonine-protein kinase
METGNHEALLGRPIANGKYVIERFLGGGAMGAVFRAEQTLLRKTVAIKVMHADLAKDATFAVRFHREALAASRLDHPASMRVLDFGEEPDGLLYIAMEYLEGRDLYKVIHEDWPLSDKRIVDILSQALAALAVAHDMGVIHRDLKPENIMILAGTNDEGASIDVVKVCDFGIAKLVDGDDEPPTTALSGSASVPEKKPAPKATTQGLIIGTPEYMSPEQAQGKKLDLRSDIYSMGIILYQLLTGRVPFDGESAVTVVVKHVTELPAPPRTVYAGVNPRLEAVCMKAVEKAPDARFANAREMRAALRAALEGAPVPVSVSASTEHALSSPMASGPGAPSTLGFAPTAAFTAPDTLADATPPTTTQAGPPVVPGAGASKTEPFVAVAPDAPATAVAAVPSRGSNMLLPLSILVGLGAIGGALYFGLHRESTTVVVHDGVASSAASTPTGMPSAVAQTASAEPVAPLSAQAPGPDKSGMLALAPPAKTTSPNGTKPTQGGSTVPTEPTHEPTPTPSTPSTPAATVAPTPTPTTPAPAVPATTQAPPPAAPVRCSVARVSPSSPSGNSMSDFTGIPGAAAFSDCVAQLGSPQSVSVDVSFNGSRKTFRSAQSSGPARACLEGKVHGIGISSKADLTGDPQLKLTLQVTCP